MPPCKNYSHESEMEVKPLLEKRVPSRNSRPIPSKCRKAVIMSCCLWFQMVSVGVGYGLAVMYVEMIRVFQASRSDAALIQSIYMGFLTGSGILWTGLIRRFGPGPCSAVATITAGAAIFASSFAIYLPIVIVLTGVTGGLAMGVIYIVPFIVTSWTFHENPGVPLVIATIGSSIGQFIIPYLFEIFIAEYGWPGAFQLIGGITLNSLPFCVIVYTSRRFYVTGNEETSILKLCDVTLLKDPMVLFILSCCLNLALTGPIESWFFADIMVLRGYERETGSLFVTLTGAGNVIGRAIGAVLRFYVKFPTLYHWIYLCPVIAISHVLVINIFDYWALFGICFLYAIPFGVTVAQVPAIMFEAAGLSRYPRAIALMNLMYGLGNLFGNLLGGFIKDVTGSYDLIFYLGVGSSLYITIATIFVIIIKKCCRLSNTYKSPKIEYRPIDRQETEENENAYIDDQTKLLNGYAGEVKLYDSVKIRPDNVNNPYDNVTLTAEFDDVDYDSGDEEHSADNPFDIDTSSIVITYNDSQNRDGTLARSVFSKTL